MLCDLVEPSPLPQTENRGEGSLFAPYPSTQHRSVLIKRRAFSLVELMVVMVILGMLAGLVAVSTRGYLISGKKGAATTQISHFVQAVDSFYVQRGRYPTTDEGLDVLKETDKSTGVEFMKKIPLDPWKNPYEYISPGSNSPYEIVSLGADGREGGEGENADISSETLNEEDA